MKIVFDTNVVISGLYSKRGASYIEKHFPISRLVPYGIAAMTAGELFKIWRDKS